MEKYARKCDCCGKGMNKGYYDAGQYYCSDRCLIWGNSSDGFEEEGGDEKTSYDMSCWERDHKQSPDNCYYTEWEEIDEEEYYDADGNVYSEGEIYYNCNLCHKQVSEPCFLCKKTLSQVKK